MTVTDRKGESTIMRISYEWRSSRCFDCNTFEYVCYKCPKMIEEERKKKIEQETKKKQKEEHERLEKEKTENERHKEVTKESVLIRINTEEVVERESVGESKKGKAGEGSGKDKAEAAESGETVQSPTQKKVD
ncbi:protein MNN4-like [Impatiens glandulifera]|uniref:protein MNN4-like n=1 Tax=Impatiens glandulifera TaxID=253017 RepID=UPI001FB19311|nr:protein MNN4-like [Impatiens glandulifera]